MFRFFLFTLLIIGLTACGGSVVTGITQQPSIEVTTITKMPNGGGIYKANIGDNNYLLFRNDGGIPHPDSFVNVEMLETVNLIEGTNFLISEGNYLDGQTKTYLFKYVKTTGSVTSENVEVGYSLNDDRLMTHAYGPKVSGNLPTGYLIYTGYNLFSTADASLFDRGSFTLRANFVTGNGSMTTEGDLFYMEARNFIIDRNTGSFSTNNATIGYINGANSKARLEGNFHGKEAAGVSGVYSDTANLGLVGAMAGSR